MSSQRDFVQCSTKPRTRARARVRAPRGGKRSGSGGPPRRPSRRWGRRLLKWGVFLGLLLTILVLVGYWGLVFYFENRLPEVFESEDYRAQTQQVSRIYSANGDVLAEIGQERRSIVAADDIPEVIKWAVLAAEDADFFEHGGLDYFGMARAMIKNLREQRISQGASTITQQVAKTFFLSSERTVSRKLKEVVMARRLEHELSKDEILYLYLNQIYWGHGRYGVREAVRFYFGKELGAVTLSDAALLAGLIAAPERFSPFRDQELATQRRAFVLNQMARHGFVSRERSDAALQEPIRLDFRGNPKVGLASYAMDTVRQVLLKEVGEERMKRGGLRVFTTIDTRLQEEAEAAVRRGLTAVDRAYNLAEPIEHVEPSRLAAYVSRLRESVPSRGLRSGEIVLGVITEVDQENQFFGVDIGVARLCRLPFEAVSRYMGRLEPQELYTVGDVIRVSPRFKIDRESVAGTAPPQLNLDQGPQGALVAVDPHTRHIRALVGGYDHATHPFNRVRHARRQSGSTFKPIVFAAAMESGIVEPMAELRNVPDSYPVGDGTYWKPRNFSNSYDGQLYTVRMALAKSINTIAVEILKRTGLRRAVDFSHRVGVQSDIPSNLSVALGSTALSPLELTNVYATFASGGYVQEPILVTRVEDSDGTVLYETTGERGRGTTAKVAYRITEMMRTVISHGTARRVRTLGRPAAGKTGTTDRGVDTWFAGYTPDLVTSVWVGFDDQRPVRGATGGRLAAPIWARFMTAAHEGTPVTDFAIPPGVDPLPPVGQSNPVAANVALPTAVEVDEDIEAGSEEPNQMELLYE